MKRIYTLQLAVETPHTTGESEVADAINAALDEPPADWGEWGVGCADVVGVVTETEEEEEEEDDCKE